MPFAQLCAGGPEAAGLCCQSWRVGEGRGLGSGALVALSLAARRTCSTGHRSMTSTWPTAGRWWRSRAGACPCSTGIATWIHTCIHGSTARSLTCPTCCRWAGGGHRLPSLGSLPSTAVQPLAFFAGSWMPRAALSVRGLKGVIMDYGQTSLEGLLLISPSHLSSLLPLRGTSTSRGFLGLPLIVIHLLGVGLEKGVF